MYKDLSFIARTNGSAGATPRKGRKARSRFAKIAIAALVLVLFLAWIDGGEEPLHSIVQPIAMPGEDIGA